MHTCKPVSTLLAPHFKLSELQKPQSEDEVEHMLKVPYASAGASDIGLTFQKGGGGISILGYVDYDYAGDLDRRRSTTGYIFALVGSVVSWKSTLQSIIALSTTEAEYMVATKVVKEAIWLKGLVVELSLVQ
ncbi:secreted RxLR effector protein 161-like [Lycium ferocissimum]|uniref:secreted RxLR effector protein 161-like n=1 Tax=Lycium ferocissimum TaxID=112874 RepID=UPI002815C7F2|nr:secreted RxLR effector protein 161-like [Lycium ferocissimum]